MENAFRLSWRMGKQERYRAVSVVVGLYVLCCMLRANELREWVCMYEEKKVRVSLWEKQVKVELVCVMDMWGYGQCGVCWTVMKELVRESVMCLREEGFEIGTIWKMGDGGRKENDRVKFYPISVGKLGRRVPPNEESDPRIRERRCCCLFPLVPQ